MSFFYFLITLTFVLIGINVNLGNYDDVVNYDQEIAQIEAHEFKLFQFNHISKTRELNGKSAKKFNEKIVIDSLSIKDYSSTGVDSIVSKEAIYLSDILYFNDDVEYKRGEFYSFKTQSLTYDKKNDSIVVPVDFVMKKFNNSFNGNSLVYDRKNGTMRANKVSANFILSEL